MGTKIDPGALELQRSQSCTINSDFEETTEPKQQVKIWTTRSLCCKQNLTRTLICISKNIGGYEFSHKPQALRDCCANNNIDWTVKNIPDTLKESGTALKGAIIRSRRGWRWHQQTAHWTKTIWTYKLTFTPPKTYNFIQNGMCACSRLVGIAPTRRHWKQ